MTSAVITRGWAEACLTRLELCPLELRAPVLAAAAWNALLADDDYPLALRRAEQVRAEPASGDPLTSGTIRIVLANVYALAGQLERAVSIAQEARQQAADRGLEVFVGLSLAMEATAWGAARDYAAARQTAMEAVEIARRVRNPALSALAFFGAAQVIWRSEPEAALLLMEDSVALARAGAIDIILGMALTVGAVIRARNGDLPGALAALQEATLQHHANGTRTVLGYTLSTAAKMLARLGEAGPAAVLSGALAAHFPGSISAEDEQAAMSKTHARARHALGDAAYDAAVGRGAAMDEDEVVGYAVGELQRVAGLLAEPGPRAPEAPPGPASGPQATLPQTGVGGVAE
jgi:ATP/maltotriose-dependent transcriptional regulator MalT